jgi:YegS/Rv2252/BmrU family lipid kinase
VPVRALEHRRLTAIALVCLATVVVLSAMVRLRWEPLFAVDADVGRWPHAWTSTNPVGYDVLYAVEVAFGTVPLTVLTVLTVGALLLRRHPRAAVWVAIVMIGSSMSTYLLKHWFARDRPIWEEPLHELASYSFPSGHASGVASSMGVAIVLTAVFVRRRRLRQGLVGTWAVLILIVAGSRVFLGVHNISDIVAGVALGFLWVLIALLLHDPAPRTLRRDPTAAPADQGRNLAVVLNPIKVEDVHAFKAMVTEQADSSGWGGPQWHETTVEDPGRAMAESAAIGGADLVIVCGGDGTVRTVCAELAGTGIPVGVVPAGTGNLLARNLGIPLYLQAAVDVALNGRDRTIDLVRVEGDGIGEDEHFMVMGGMGFDAAVMEGASEQIKARIGWLAYFVSGMRQLRSPTFKVEISVDGAPFTRHRAVTAVIGNVGYLTAGIPLLPDAAIDDGELDVVIVSPRRFLSWIPLVWRVLSKGKRVDDSLNRMTGRRVTVRTAHDTARQLDGDPIGPGKELRAECIHGRLIVRVPG